MLKKIISILLGCSLLMSVAPVTNATELNSTSTKLDELIADGLTESEASKVLQYEKIKSQLAETGQVLDLNENDQIIVTTDPSIRSLTSTKAEAVGLPEEDISFLQEDYEEKKDLNVLTHEERMKEFEEYREKNPTATNDKLEFEDGSWIEFTVTQERIDEITEDNVNVYALPNQKEMTSKNWPSDGNFSATAKLKQFDGTTYSKIYVTQITKVSNGQKHVEFTGEACGRAAVGISEVGDCTLQGQITETDYYKKPEIWTQNEAKASFKLSASHSVSLAGVYSFTVNQNSTWEQYASIRCSLIGSHYYAGIYGVGI